MSEVRAVSVRLRGKTRGVLNTIRLVKKGKFEYKILKA